MSVRAAWEHVFVDKPLANLVAQGLTQREIATAVGRSTGTVRYWLRQHGLDAEQRQLRRGRAEARRGGSTELRCPQHGSTTHVLERSGRVRCLKCRSEAVSRRRRKVKELLVAEAGGHCQLCGYDRCLAALQFHHVDPAQKSFGLGSRGLARSIDKARAEVAKCALLCSNCHAEVESGLISVTLAPLERTLV